MKDYEALIGKERERHIISAPTMKDAVIEARKIAGEGRSVCVNSDQDYFSFDADKTRIKS